MVETGMTFGEWTVGQRLGGGGNGEVFEASSTDRSGQYAIKFLKVADQPSRLSRFRAEVAFLLNNSVRAGILPLVDNDLNPTGDQPLWYVMPRAQRLIDVLGTATAEEIIDAIATVTETLAGLARDDIGHRDIKPDNLFYLDHRPVIGDFGLVTYPDKDPVTQYGEKVGPSDYMAPEMRRDADTAAHEPADVWSISKTLWELLVQRHPLPGPHRPDDEAYAVQAYRRFAAARDIDHLMREATYIDPSRRITLAGFANELRECLRPPTEPSSASDTAELERQIAARTAYGFEHDEAVADRRRFANDAFRELQSVLSDAYHAFAPKVPHFRSTFSNQESEALRDLGFASTPFAFYGWGSRFSYMVNRTSIIVTLSVGMRVQTQHSPAEMRAAMHVREGRDSIHHDRFDWSLNSTAILGSATFRNYLTDVHDGFASCFPQALKAIALVLDGVIEPHSPALPPSDDQ